MSTRSDADKISEALQVIQRYGGIDGSHHKQWVLDQVVRKLTDDMYPEWVEGQTEGGYEWEEGIAP